jgi:hypothetical protein
MIMRRPRAPILRCSASSAMASEGVVGEAQLHVLLEQSLVLTRDRVARLGEDLDEGRTVELVQGADDRQAGRRTPESGRI